MNTRMKLLKVDIEAEESQIALIFERLSTHRVQPTNPDHTIVAGYYLHNLYTAFEHLSMLVADAFENQIEDRAEWHALLLRRMNQDIEGIRPRLFSEKTYQCLDELRRFRHVFRSAYSITLDPDKMALVLTKAQELKALYPPDLAKFKAFLDTL